MGAEQEKHLDQFNWQNLITPDIIPILGFARQTALNRGDVHIDDLHLLAGIVESQQDEQGEVVQFFSRIGIDFTKVKSKINHVLEGHKDRLPRIGAIDYDSSVPKIFELAADEAKMLGEKQVTPITLLLGIVREERGFAAGALNTFMDESKSLNDLRSEAKIFLEEQQLTVHDIMREVKNPSFIMPDKESFLSALQRTTREIVKNKHS